MEPWSKKLERTWLHSVDACVEIDNHIAQLRGPSWNLRGSTATPQAVLPTRFVSTVEALRAYGPTPSSSIHCSVLLALLGELLLCAEDGGILRKATVDTFAAGESEPEIVGNATRLLRNAVCHPAASATEDDEEATNIVSFANYVTDNFRDENWAAGLRSRPGDLNRREVALFALRLVDSLGWTRAGKWRMKMKNAKRPHD
jgi:hypothetical protein